MVVPSFVPIVFASCVSSIALAQAGANVRQGVIRSTDGAVLKLVWVQELGTWNGRLTDADGQFQFPAGKPATLLFDKDGFRPEIRLTTGSEGPDDMSVVLEPEARAALNLRSCRRRGGCPFCELELAKAPGLQIARGGDVDFAAYYATYKRGGFFGELGSMTGVHVGGLTPTPAWVAGLSSFTVRSLRCGGDQWIDLRGVSPQGLESRWVGYAVGHVEYSNVPTPVARIFDKAIDGGCCR